jgi:hypothetical protein
MTEMNDRRICEINMARRVARIRRLPARALFLLVLFAIPARALPGACSRITIEGEVSAGQEWSAPLGHGWVFRITPVQPAGKYSGWDLVVDRAQPAGFPDALHLATPPYSSLNEREIATTFSLRAQDVIGWNPRTFHFLTDPAAFRSAQQLYLSSHGPADPQTAARLLDLIRSASPGELRILDARLSPGIADPALYAQNWALAAARTPHQVVPPPSGNATPRGLLLWMRFSITLWLPPGWRAPAQWTAASSACSVPSV